jgi:hypothetical protein
MLGAGPRCGPVMGLVPGREVARWQVMAVLTPEPARVRRLCRDGSRDANRPGRPFMDSTGPGMTAEHRAGSNAAESEEHHRCTALPPSGNQGANGKKKGHGQLSAGHSLDRLARPKGLEPLTFRFVVRRLVVSGKLCYFFALKAFCQVKSGLRFGWSRPTA